MNRETGIERDWKCISEAGAWITDGTDHSKSAQRSFSDTIIALAGLWQLALRPTDLALYYIFYSSS